MPSSKRMRFRYVGAVGDRRFAERIQELLERARRLQELEARGFQYQPVRVKATTVKAHRRKAYTVMRPMKRR